MPDYHYKIFNDKGEIHFGRLQASDYTQARGKLQDKDQVIVELRSTQAGLPFWPFRKRLPLEQELFFYIQFSSLLATDIPILRALEIITPQIRHPQFRASLETCQADIQKGLSFSEALQKHERFFSNMVLGMVEAGEESGTLDIIFKQLSAYAEQKNQFRHELITALSYPVLLFFTAILVTLIIVLFVYPLFLEIFEANQVALPMATRLFAKCSIFLKEQGLVFLGVLAVMCAFCFRYQKTPEGSAAFDRFIQGTPLLGVILKQFHMHQLFFNMSLLLHNGVPLLKAVELLGKTLTNITITQLLADIWVTLRQGGAMSDAVQKHDELPVLVPQMILVAEQTGKMDEVLEELSNYFGTTARRHLRRLTLVMEPLLLLVMGILVTFLMASLLLPMFRMVKTLR